jgi:hypothetical protein
MMNRMPDNRRWVACLLALAVMLMGLPVGASWQCLSGKPCPRDCPMLSGKTMSAGRHMAAAPPVCPNCAQAPRAPIAGPAHAGCAAGGCVLRERTTTEATVGSRFVVPFPVLALPPPADVAALTPIPARFRSTRSCRFFPQRRIPPLLGRAPPPVS